MTAAFLLFALDEPCDFLPLGQRQQGIGGYPFHGKAVGQRHGGDDKLHMFQPGDIFFIRCLCIDADFMGKISKQRLPQILVIVKIWWYQQTTGKRIMRGQFLVQCKTDMYC